MTISQFVRMWRVVAWLRVAPGSVRGAEQSDAGYVLRRAAAAERSRATQPPVVTKLTIGHFVRGLVKLTVSHFISVSDKTDH